MPEGAVNCCRPCDWGNPFRIGDVVDFREPDGHGDSILVAITPELAVALFEAYVRERGWEEQIRRELAGKDLVCWCARGAPCHVDVLLRIANPAPKITVYLDTTPRRCPACGEPVRGLA